MAQLIAICNEDTEFKWRWKVLFQLAEERKNRETFFSHTSESLGVIGVRYQ